MRSIPRLIATDLDGTIVRSDGTISPRTVAAFTRLEGAGARFVLVTGRPPRVMTPIAAAFGRRGTAICANGALTYDMSTGDVLAGNLIPPENLAAAARALRKAIPGIGIAVEYAYGHAADDAYEAATWEVNASIPRPGDDVLFARPAAKLLGRHMDYTPDELLALAAPVLDGIVCVSHSNGKSLIEASAVGVSKASAVAELAASLGIVPGEAVAFGDMPNDLPMLSWAGTSCAVANAHPDVLAAATHVIGAVSDDGVAAYLERFFPAAAAPEHSRHALLSTYITVSSWRSPDGARCATHHVPNAVHGTSCPLLRSRCAMQHVPKAPGAGLAGGAEAFRFDTRGGVARLDQEG